MSVQRDPAGLAALSICEALLLVLHDYNLLPEHEIVGLLRDAAATCENAGDTSEAHNDTHSAAAEIINDIIADGIFSRSA